ncbi:MAG TPA: hypothetical protein VE404_06465 [Verrucomicrobiae bacterium]|nr:hypothetical protein [Verrucomicrobiae bacterium]
MRFAGKTSVLALAVTLFATLPALAIQNGPPDNGNHPTVGMAYISFNSTCSPFDVTTGCGAVLISQGDSSHPAVALTTGDCAEAVQGTVDAYVAGGEQNVQAWVGFNDSDPWACGDPDPSAHLNALRVILPVQVHPDYQPTRFGVINNHNVGVLLLETRPSVTLPTPSALPAQGSLDSLPSDSPIVSVGFSPTNFDLQQGSNGQFGRRFYHVFETARRATTTRSVATSPWSHVTQITDDQSCYGYFADDGSANFSTSGQLLSLMREQNQCEKTEVGQRVDKADILSFINSFLP